MRAAPMPVISNQRRQNSNPARLVCAVSARASNSVLPSPLWGGHRGPSGAVLGAKNADAKHRLWQSAGVGVVVVAQDVSSNCDPHLQPLPSRLRACPLAGV